MDNRVVVRPEHLNHHGYLFGGDLLRWADEYAWLTCSLEFPGCTMVTIAIDEAEFRERVVCGAILRYHVARIRRGRTSVTYRVKMHADEPGASGEKHVFATRVTFVRVDAEGRKTPLPDAGEPR